jgi:putative peptide zinc metalloprotease protein
MSTQPTAATLSNFAGKLRPEIRWVSHPDSGRWVAFDPISNAFFYFSGAEHQAALLLDGHRSAEDIARELNRTPSFRSLSKSWVESLVARLTQSELLLSIPGTPLSPLRSYPQRKSWIHQVLANPLAIRIPLLDPESIVNTLGSAGGGVAGLMHGLASLLFSRPLLRLSVILFSVVALLMLVKVLAHPEQVFYDVARLQGDRWLGLIILWIAIKSLHELGHYLATVRWKADCHEIGILLLCFTPCLYCDTTQSWKLQSRWERAAIAAGGVYMEIWIAIAAGIVFLNSQPGMWHTLGAVAFLTCTLGTLLINGNPCFRYDGYYILSDLWGVPNLASQSRNALWDCFIHALGGRKPQADRFDKPVWQLSLFAIASGLYRFVMMVFLAIFLWTWLVPLGLGFLVWIVAMTMVVALVFGLRQSATSLLTEIFARTPIRLGRLFLVASALGVAIYLLVAIPIPRSVQSRGFIDMQNAQSVYAADDGTLLEFPLSEDGWYEPGQRVFALESIEKNWECLKARQELELLEQRISLLSSAQAVDESSAFELPALIELQNERKANLSILTAEREKLGFRAPSRGRFLPSATVVPLPYRDGQTPFKQDHAIQAEREGMRVERGQALGWFTPQNDVVSVQALMSERDARLLHPGTAAYLILDSRTGQRVPAAVVRIATEPVEAIPAELYGDNQLSVLRGIDGSLHPESPCRLVSLHSEDPRWNGYRGSRATVQLILPGKTVSEWLIEQVTERLNLR